MVAPAEPAALGPSSRADMPLATAGDWRVAGQGAGHVAQQYGPAHRCHPVVQPTESYTEVDAAPHTSDLVDVCESTRSVEVPRRPTVAGHSGRRHSSDRVGDLSEPSWRC